MSAQFNIKAANPAAVAQLSGELGLPRFVAATLVARGIDKPEAARQFLSPSLDRDWLDPYEIPGLCEVTDALEAAIRRNDHIIVFGDFDLDGISATTVLTRGLRALGANATPMIPRRFEEGYALTEASISRMIEYDPDFVVTIDCGIACKEEVKILLDLGLGVAITDHHEPADLVPEGVPVSDPKCDERCESDILAGVGVALKLVQTLGGRFGQPHLWREYTDFATLGTVADLMPIRGENRALVADGIERINTAPRPCIAALLAEAGASDKPVSATNLSFSIIPRLNAAGRMGDAQLALDLLLTDDFEEASRLSEQLEGVNDQRRAIEAELSEMAQDKARETYRDQRVLVVAGEGWHEGVKGIVASRLVNIYGVPTLLFSIEGDEARGSGRSVGQVNLFKAVESTSDLLTRFGGHEAAVGVTLPTKNLPEFERRITAYMDELPEDAFHPLVEIDSCVNLDELTLENVEALDSLAPFGQDNSTPVYLARDVMLGSCRAVGAEKNHFSCMLSNGRSSVSGIMFHCSDIETLMKTDSVVNAAFELQIDEWRGRRSVKAMLKSLAPVQPCAALEACLNPENVSFVADLYATSDNELCEEAPPTPQEIEDYETARESNRAQWKRKACEDPADLESEIIHAIIGDKPLHDAQYEILNYLHAGNSVLGVMATGRGKSLTFQVHAAVQALALGEASLFVYPLRALIADQAFHLREVLDAFGIGVVTLTGESTPDERQDAFEGLANGTYDIVLTTPEFLTWHADEFVRTGRIRFIVMDEAHHLSRAKAGQRVAYATFGSVFEQFGAPKPVVLALTATADAEAEAAIKRELPITECVFDSAARTNLQVDDQRNLRDRDAYLANIVATGEKTVVYVNSREQSVAVARSLRKHVPQLASLIGFYNAGLSRQERKRIEELFRNDALSVLVTTSAFGEGVDIPNIRHLVLYHMPFNEIEFNQISGRVGRDGQDATVHLLFGRADANTNENILHSMTPDRDCLAQVYRTLRTMQRHSDSDFFAANEADLAAKASTDSCTVAPASVACGIAVFRELGLIETRIVHEDRGLTCSIHVNEAQQKVELTDSVRYREGLDETEIFHAFRDWVLTCDVAGLQWRISHPILPNDN